MEAANTDQGTDTKIKVFSPVMTPAATPAMTPAVTPDITHEDYLTSPKQTRHQRKTSETQQALNVQTPDKRQQVTFEKTVLTSNTYSLT